MQYTRVSAGDVQYGLSHFISQCCSGRDGNLPTSTGCDMALFTSLLWNNHMCNMFGGNVDHVNKVFAGLEDSQLI